METMDPGYSRGNSSDQRRGRISIHSLLTQSTEAGPSSTDQRPPVSLHASSSSSHSQNTQTSFTALNSTVNESSNRSAFGAASIRSNPSSPTTTNDFRTKQSPISPSLVAADMHGRTPRAPRPSYSEEQKFFIMYARIMKDQTWPEIEDQFNVIFGTRTKGGLTSVYYRVRKDWGLMEVLKSGPDSFTADCKEVERRARNFSSEFLAQIGYLAD